MNKVVSKRYVSDRNTVLLEGVIEREGFLPHGEVNITDSNGQRLIFGWYVNGKPHGKWHKYYDNGSPFAEYQYVLGVLTGVSKQYWNNGKLARECKYLEGDYDYEEKTYNKKGELEKYSVYKKGKLVKLQLKLNGKRLEFDATSRKLKLPWDVIPKKICSLDQNNHVKCKTTYQYWTELIEVLPPKAAERILKELNDLYAELGLDKDNKNLTSCGGSYVATKTNLRTMPTKSGKNSSAPVSQSEINDITNACLSAVDRGLSSSGGLYEPESQRTRDAVNQIDQVVSNCREDDNSMIALHVVVIGALITLGGVLVNAGVDAYGHYKSAEAARYAADAAKEAATISGDKGMEAAVASALISSGHLTAKQVAPGVFEIKSGDGNTTTTVDTKSKTITIISEDDNGFTETVITQKETVVTYRDKQGTPLKREEQNTTKQPSSGGAGSGKTPTQQPIDESGMSKCEKMKSWWAQKRAYCEQSHWQTYDCQETLRIFTRCSDPALVQPTPDGDGVVCPHEGGMTDKEFRELECKRKSMIMVPDGFGGELCVSKDDLALPENDICTDPQAQCQPDWMVPSETIDTPNRFVNIQQEIRVKQSTVNDKTLTYTNVYPTFNPYSAVKEISQESFDTTIEKNNKTHFVVFASKSCGPCHKVLSVFNDEATNFKDATFNRVDASQNPDLTQKFDIKYTPTILVFKKGKIVGQRKVGAASREVLVEYIQRAFNLQDKKKKS